MSRWVYKLYQCMSWMTLVCSRRTFFTFWVTFIIFFLRKGWHTRENTPINDYWACVMVQCRWWLRHVFFFCVIHFVPGCLCVYFLPRCIKLIHAFSPCSYLTSYFISWFSFPCAFLLLLFPLSRHLGFSSAVSCSPRWPPLPWLPFCVCI